MKRKRDQDARRCSVTDVDLYQYFRRICIIVHCRRNKGDGSADEAPAASIPTEADTKETEPPPPDIHDDVDEVDYSQFDWNASMTEEPSDIIDLSDESFDFIFPAALQSVTGIRAPPRVDLIAQIDAALADDANPSPRLGLQPNPEPDPSQWMTTNRIWYVESTPLLAFCVPFSLLS